MAKACLGLDAPDLDPSQLDENQAELVIEAMLRQFETGRARGERFPPAVGACMADELRKVPVDKLLALNQKPLAEIEAFFLPVIGACVKEAVPGTS